MKNELVLGLIGIVLLAVLITATAGMASSSEQSTSEYPSCSAEYEPLSGSPHAEKGVPVDHDDHNDCEMSHMSSAN